MTATANPFLMGNYAPVPDERTDEYLEVEGRIPAELRGRYLRIGPNPHAMPDGPYHWFMGDGMVHGIELADGRANWYRNRWVRTDEIADAVGAPHAEGPAQPLYDVSNTNVIGHAGRILSLTEGAIPYELSPTLDTKWRQDFGGPLPGGLTAHPKIDPVTGELHAFTYWFEEPFCYYHVIDAQGNLVRTEPITMPRAVMMHDFALTRDNVIFFDFPVVFDLDVMPFPFRWDDEHQARIGVMPRFGGNADITWIDIDPCYVFHPMNAYEDGGNIVLDVPRHPTMFATHGELVQGPNRGGPPALHRWTIDVPAGKVRDELVDERGQEFPRVNETLLMSKHRYGYAAQVDSADAFDSSLYFKHDFDRGTVEEHSFGSRTCPSEFVFVPAPNGTSEDDGYLMGFVYDGAADTSSFQILDAHDFTAAPVAVVELPRRVPFGFHGNWVPDSR